MTAKTILGLCCILIALGSSLASFTFMQSDIEYDGQLSIVLQHALDNTPDPVFTDRGTVNIQSIRSGAVVLNQNPLTSEERAKLMMLKENDGLYRLRSVATTAGGKKFSFLTFTKGAALFDSQLSDILTVSLDSSGNPVSINLATSLSMTEEPISEHKLQQFNTTVFVKHMEQGPTPDTAAYIQKIEQEKMARDRGETKDNRSFFAKYWMYIVPVVIFVLISSATNPEAGAAAGAR